MRSSKNDIYSAISAGHSVSTSPAWPRGLGLGCNRHDLRLDHDPPLAARPRFRRGLGKKTYYQPPANDPDHLVYRPHGPEFEGSHLIKTNVRGDHGQFPDRVLIKRENRKKANMSESWKNSDKPTGYGAILGDALAMIAAAGRKNLPEGTVIPDTCLTCAFREGALPNRMGGTVKEALDCVLLIDGDRFACHQGMKDGEPKRICAGYLAAILAPFSFVKEVIASAHKDLDAFDDLAPDPVRDDYVRWLLKLDPDGAMDVYQIARAYALRDDVPKPITVAERKFKTGPNDTEDR
jgi:hypothetical protein